MRQLYVWTERRYGEPYSLKTNLHPLKSRQACLTQLSILPCKKLSRTSECAAA
ncbi:Protein transport protein SEC31, partial [Clarias magur]